MAPLVANAQSAARSLFAALNQRDVSAVLSLLADDVTYENLGSSTVLRGRAAVGRFYLEALAALPEDAVFVLEGPSGPDTDPWVADAGATGGPVFQAGVAWRVELNGQVVPLSRGVGVYWADPRTGRLSRILDNPEHTVKQASPSLASAAWGSPLLRGLGPLVMPAAMSVGSFLTNMAPGGGGGGGGGEATTASGRAPTSKGGGGGGGGLAGSVMSTLSSMMPFQSQSPAAAANRRGVEGGGGGGGIVSGGGPGPVYRDHTRAGGRAVTVAAAAASAAAAAASGGGGVAGLSAVAPKSQLGGGGSSPVRGNGAAAPSGAVGGASAVAAPAARSSGASAGTRPTHGTTLTTTTTAAVANAATTTGLTSSSGVRVAVTAAPSSAAAPAVPAASAAAAAAAAAAPTAMVTAAVSGREGVALGSTGEPIRMRPLSEPAPLAGASVSAASSLASYHAEADDVDVGGALAATAAAGAGAAADASSPPAPSGTAAAAAAGSVSMAGSGSSGSSSAGGGGSGRGGSSTGGGSVAFGSVDSGSDSDSGGGGGGPAPLPFPPSTSLAASLTGLWEKDLAASQVEAYESMLDVLELGGLQKVTARLIDGLDVRQDKQRFEISFVTVVPFFRVTEKSRFDGGTTMMRRDLRSGRQTAQAAHIPGGVAVDMAWEAPLAGSLRECYVVSGDGDQMAVTSTLRIGARAAVATQVYRRSSRNKSDLLASKRSSYGSMEDVLKSQEKRFGKMKE